MTKRLTATFVQLQGEARAGQQAQDLARSLPALTAVCALFALFLSGNLNRARPFPATPPLKIRRTFTFSEPPQKLSTALASEERMRTDLARSRRDRAQQVAT